jgi:N-acetylglucosaminyldiphosphoundecaprenol N-acetyl-beta-D-mannosaminyltransferase
MWVEEFMAGTETLEAPSHHREAPPERRPNPKPPIALLGVAFDPVTLAGALRRIQEMVASRQPHHLVTANVDFLVQSQRDVELQRILNDADLVLCDGTPLVWASRLLGNPLPERVAGSDLVPWLIRVAEKKRYRLFFLGATPESNARAVAKVREKFPAAIIAGHYSPPFRPLLEMDHDDIVPRIRAAAPDVLLVSFGCPKAEKWIAMHYRSLGVPVTIGVGATIDFLAGRVKRAPRWMQRAGVEWLFRLGQEPRRLFGRYAADFWRFGRALAVQAWRTLSWGRRTRLPIRRTNVLKEATWQRVCLPDRLDAEVVRRDAAVWAAADELHGLLDLADVRFIDSTGVGLLLRLRKALLAAGRCLVLVAPSPVVQRALRSLRVLDLFVTAADACEARRQIAARLEPSAPVIVNDGAPQPMSWRGEITLRNADEVWKRTESQLAPLCAARRHLTVDLSEVSFIDSTALALMVRARNAAEAHGAVLKFAGAQPNVRNVVRRSKLESLLVEGAA